MLFIKIESEMTEGGCNACVPFKTEIATLVDGGITTHIGDLSVSSIIMAVAVKARFKQQLVCDITEDYTLFQRETSEIREIETFGSLTYSNHLGDSYTTRDYHQNIDELLLQVNNILQSIFNLEPIALLT